MKYQLFSIAFLLFSFSFVTLSGQLTYENKRGEQHFLGKIERSDFLKEPHKLWYDKFYNNYTITDEEAELINNNYNKDVQIDVYLGTWCGDSKREVSRFLKIVVQTDININNVNFIALDDRLETYKQGPHGEEKGKNIHRVPTFVFTDSDNNEIARIVEFPVNTLERDISQIYLGVASQPNYKLANLIGEKMLNNNLDSLEQYLTTNHKYFKRQVNKEAELNTFGYVLISANRIKEAILVFKMNTLLFPESANVYDSLAEAYMKDKQHNAAIENYLKSLKLDPESKSAEAGLLDLMSMD